MAKRRNFSKQVKVDCIKRATRNGVTYCEECGLPTRKFDIDHINADALTGKPVLSNAQLLCQPCHAAKTAKDVPAIAQAKRREARALGAKRPKQAIRSAGFPPVNKPKLDKLPIPQRRDIYGRGA